MELALGLPKGDGLEAIPLPNGVVEDPKVAFWFPPPKGEALALPVLGFPKGDGLEVMPPPNGVP